MNKTDEPISCGQKTGLVMVVTGNGKGKTTSALGQSIRAIGHGYEVCFLQFMKGQESGELLAAEKFLPDLTIYQLGLDAFLRDKGGEPDPRQVEAARRGLRMSREIINSAKFDIVVLDEINVAMFFGLLSVEDVVSLITNKPSHVTLILTGRYAPKEIVEIADLVSEIKEVKHHFRKGIKARKGIEY